MEIEELKIYSSTFDVMDLAKSLSDSAWGNRHLFMPSKPDAVTNELIDALAKAIAYLNDAA